MQMEMLRKKIWNGAMETKMERPTRVESESIIEDGNQSDPAHGIIEDERYNELLARGRALEVKVLVGFADDSRLRRCCTKKLD